MKIIVLFISITLLASCCKKEEVLVSYEIKKLDSPQVEKIEVFMTKNHKNDKLLEIQIKQGRNKSLIQENQNGLFIYSDEKGTFVNTHSFVDSSIITVIDMVSPITYYQLTDTRSLGSKTYYLNGLECIVYRFKENLTKVPDWLTYSYYLKGFGFICYYYYYQDDIMRITSIKDCKAYPSSVILDLVDTVINDSTFFIHPQLLEPPTID